MSNGSPPPSSTPESNTSLIQSTTYQDPLETPAFRHYLPIAVACLIALYGAAFFARYLYWQYKRRRKRLLSVERSRLRAFWLRVIEEEEQRKRCPSPDPRQGQVQERHYYRDEEKHPISIPPSSSSSSTSSSISRVQSATLPSLSSATTLAPIIHPPAAATTTGARALTATVPSSSVSMGEACPQGPFMQPHCGISNNSSGYYSMSTRGSRMKSLTRSLTSSQWRRTHWALLTPAKRQLLLWQWSVSMGYCRYHHAHKMEEVIQHLGPFEEKTDL